MKLDFRKAYDSVRWPCVDRVLECMGFRIVWTKMDMGLSVIGYYVSLG